MTMGQLEKDLAEWHEGRYGAVNVPKTVRKLGEEFGEFLEAVMGEDPDAIATEAADVIFIMTHIVRARCGVGALDRAMVRKLEVIKNRPANHKMFKPGTEYKWEGK